MFTTTELYIVLVFLRKKAPFLKETFAYIYITFAYIFTVFFGVITLIRTLKNVGENLEKWSFFFQKPGNSLEF